MLPLTNKPMELLMITFDETLGICRALKSNRHFFQYSQ